MCELKLEVFAFDKPVVVVDVPQLAKILFVRVLAIPLPHIVPGLKGVHINLQFCRTIYLNLEEFQCRPLLL